VAHKARRVEKSGRNAREFGEQLNLLKLDIHGGNMVFEMAQLTIKPGMESAFEKGVSLAVPLFQRARGCHGLQLLRSVEQPSLYTLMVTWQTVDDHNVHFRGSEDFQEWRRLVGEYFANPPQVTHVQIALAGF
jgi:heme-degrading monooxygenase HmoA